MSNGGGGSSADLLLQQVKREPTEEAPPSSLVTSLGFGGGGATEAWKQLYGDRTGGTVGASASFIAGSGVGGAAASIPTSVEQQQQQQQQVKLEGEASKLQLQQKIKSASPDSVGSPGEGSGGSAGGKTLKQTSECNLSLLGRGVWVVLRMLTVRCSFSLLLVSPAPSPSLSFRPLPPFHRARRPESGSTTRLPFPQRAIHQVRAPLPSFPLPHFPSITLTPPLSLPSSSRRELEHTSTLYTSLQSTHSTLVTRLTSLEHSLTILESDRMRFEAERAEFLAQREAWERERAAWAAGSGVGAEAGASEQVKRARSEEVELAERERVGVQVQAREALRRELERDASSVAVAPNGVEQDRKRSRVGEE